ncbi:MAG: GNAT family N-acetyltransferase [Oscillospiraceae bacterium]|nr:GNAT family N-acetyltransferase [Oscillospiraceae bacterium]
MNNVNLRIVSDADAQFLTFIMNTDSVLNALNELPTQLEDWVDAIKEWSKDNDEEDFMISDDETPIGWLGINSLESADKVAYLKLAAILPEYHNKGIGRYAINQVIEMLRQRKYLKVALYTDQENYKARACYSKCGFEVTETFTEEMANGKTVARCKMELDLT